MSIVIDPFDESSVNISDGFSIYLATVDFDSSYPTGGYPWPANIPPLAEHFETLLGVYFECPSGYSAEYDRTNRKIKVHVSGGTEVTNGTDLSGITGVHMRAEGWTD